MSDCCTVSPATEIAPPSDSPRLVCSRCGQPGTAVSLLTLKHQVKLPHLAAVEAGPFAFCRSPECPVVYFNASGIGLTLTDVRQVPTVKKTDNPLLCYCFGFDLEMARAEIRATGRCTVPEHIAAEMKAERCACEVRNPQGSCCFANVTAAVNRELAAARGKPVADPKLRVLSGFTRQLIVTRGRPSADEANAFLAAGFAEQQVLELILALAVKTLSNYSNHSFGTPVDDMFKGRLWTPPAA